MIKGINKQIIEIKCTNNEYFDKILLFVNSEKSNVPRDFLVKQANNVSCQYLTAYKRKSFLKRPGVQLALMTGLFVIVTILLVLLVMLF